MCTLYSYMRICDDIGDDLSIPLDVRRERLAAWERIVRRFLGVTDSATPPLQREQADSRISHCESELWVLPALRDIVSHHRIPEKYLLDVICGVRMDLDATEPSSHPTALECRYQTFDELRNYCYHVAGVVGLCCIHVWGFQGESAIQRAVDCGLAFQLTNILRDLAEDSEDGRVYLPQEDLDRFGYTADEIRQRVNDDRFRRLMAFQISRTEEYYRKAQGLYPHLDPSGRPILHAMVRVYGGLLNEIRKRDGDVYSQHISLPVWQKLLISADAMIRRRFPGKSFQTDF